VSLLLQETIPLGTETPTRYDRTPVSLTSPTAKTHCQPFQPIVLLRLSGGLGGLRFLL
jgi:hypothetical protein